MSRCDSEAINVEIIQTGCVCLPQACPCCKSHDQSAQEHTSSSYPGKKMENNSHVYLGLLQLEVLFHLECFQIECFRTLVLVRTIMVVCLNYLFTHFLFVFHYSFISPCLQKTLFLLKVYVSCDHTHIVSFEMG